jgi:L-rhamnose mutarotase
MECFAWKARVLPGKLEEYVRRHDEIWPEMSEVLDEAGISNYTIWTEGETLFGYYECDSVANAARVQADSPTVDRWNAYMKDVMVMEFDPETGTAVQLKQVFLYRGNGQSGGKRSAKGSKA